MESLSLCLSSSSPIFKPHKIIPKTPPNSLQIPIPSPSDKFHGNSISTFMHSLSSKIPLKPQISLPILMGFLPSYPSFASEIADPSGQRINLESILVSINDFFNKYPYFVFSVTFIWLIVLPLSEEYLRKYKFISALNAFKKLRDDSCLQLLDIRDEKMLGFLGSPNLRMFKKDVVQITYDERDEDGFLKKVLEKFADPNNTSLCIVDNFTKLQEHPYLNRPWYTLHPCGTNELMKLLLSNTSLSEDKVGTECYIISWLSVVSQVVGLRMPLQMAAICHE